jgi:hypothetical protein
MADDRAVLVDHDAIGIGLDLDRPGATEAYDRIDPSLLATLQTLQGVLWVSRGGADGATQFRLALKEFLPAAAADPALAPLLPLMQARIASRALDALDLIRAGDDADGAAWALLAPLAPLVEAAVHRCGSEPVLRRWQPAALRAVLVAYEDDLYRRQGLAFERVPWLTLIAALGLRPGMPPNSVDERNALAGTLQNRGLARAGGGDLAGATRDYDRAIKLGEAIGKEHGAAWSVPLRNDLATTRFNRALAHLHNGNRAAAMTDVTACLAIQQPLVAALGAACPPAYRAVLDAALRLRAQLASTDGATPRRRSAIRRGAARLSRKRTACCVAAPPNSAGRHGAASYGRAGRRRSRMNYGSSPLSWRVTAAPRRRPRRRCCNCAMSAKPWSSCRRASWPAA